MFRSIPGKGIRAAFTALAMIALCTIGYASTTVGGEVVGNAGVYNYSPSVIQTGNVQQFWWCGQAVNPNDPSQDTDTIQYESINVATQQVLAGPETVLAETPGAWDYMYTCNPQVVEGTFTNPLGNGNNYTYALYYVACGSNCNGQNAIGVAFSNDGVTWAKYPNPVITPNPNDTVYGVGQPAPYNSNGGSAIDVFYEDTYPSEAHYEATSTDGVHFTTQGAITTNGLNQVGIAGQSSYVAPNWGDLAYDNQAGYWYAVYNMLVRPSATTGGVQERGQAGVIVYKIPASSLLTGSTPWSQVFNADTNLTGYESNFLAGFLRDKYGNVNVSGYYPDIAIYTSASFPQPGWDSSPASRGGTGGVGDWRIAWNVWVPGAPLIPFQRYFNGSRHEVTTGWIDPSGGFHLEATEGYLYESPQAGATVAIYGCLDGSNDYFVSIYSNCENSGSTAFSFLGINGYLYSSSGSGREALYRCYTGVDHFVSTSSTCEGQHVDYLLGYAEINQ
jgi:hypothetical protein